MSALTAGAMRLQPRLASFYLFYYATVGAFMPYWSPYLAARGFSPVQMGIAYALMGLMRTVVPLAWGWYTDHYGGRMKLIRIASLAALTLFLIIPFMPSVLWIGAVMMGYTVFWHALLPQFEAVTLSHLSARGGDYSRVRLWGSVGFIITVLGLGVLLDRTGILWLPWLVGIFWLGMALSTWTVPEPPPIHLDQTERPSIWTALKNPVALALLFACFCSQLSYAPYYNFFTLFLERHNYAHSYIGLLWALGVVAEIGMFMVAARFIGNLGARKVMLIALAATVLRWAATAGAVDSIGVLLIAQMAHALSFGAYHAVAMHYVQRLFPGALQGRGQAVYNAVAYGAGGSIGSIASGYLWEGLSPEAVFYSAAVVALFGFWVAYRKLPDL
ncbi:MFS transporter [Stenotrophobium rhamnosiphilum]|uniref:MFS transporter n=1 Tax=Stenotrophobium rhamnosiphilum TaxID=2029166 RepID=A0A2T5MEW1_9GAMM|nr:MFS transporter [Stenotrophobium rhamnosiphilum]PTU31104.1 MFS transporter [Stenotrophobium rhamnosiphilum]